MATAADQNGNGPNMKNSSGRVRFSLLPRLYRQLLALARLQCRFSIAAARAARPYIFFPNRR